MSVCGTYYLHIHHYWTVILRHRSVCALLTTVVITGCESCVTVLVMSVCVVCYLPHFMIAGRESSVTVLVMSACVCVCGTCYLPHLSLLDVYPTSSYQWWMCLWHMLLATFIVTGRESHVTVLVMSGCVVHVIYNIISGPESYVTVPEMSVRGTNYSPHLSLLGANPMLPYWWCVCVFVCVCAIHVIYHIYHYWTWFLRHCTIDQYVHGACYSPH